MPIYEFYCPDCHRIYNFLSRKVNTRKRPACPTCGRPRLERKPSRFAVSSGHRPRDDADGVPENFDEAGLERAMQALEADAGSLDDDDPRQAARLMRTLMDASGMEMGSAMEEAIQRMEAGEDPDRIEEELGDALEADDPLSPSTETGAGRIARRFLPPSIDGTLHEM